MRIHLDLRNELETHMSAFLTESFVLLYSKWYYMGRIGLIIYSTNYYKYHMYDTVNANGLKHSVMNISIYQIYKGESYL
jgi:hypothetical protein